MKEKIKEWLGINDLSDSMAKLQNEIFMRKMVGEAIEDALKGASDDGYARWFFSPDFGNTLQRALETASIKTAESWAIATVKSKIDTESFIDDVVERIKRKQVVDR